MNHFKSISQFLSLKRTPILINNFLKTQTVGYECLRYNESQGKWSHSLIHLYLFYLSPQRSVRAFLCVCTNSFFSLCLCVTGKVTPDTSGLTEWVCSKRNKENHPGKIYMALPLSLHTHTQLHWLSSSPPGSTLRCLPTPWQWEFDLSILVLVGLTALAAWCLEGSSCPSKTKQQQQNLPGGFQNIYARQAGVRESPFFKKTVSVYCLCPCFSVYC